MNIALTHEAQEHLDRYLRRMKVSLYGARSIDFEDVERDVLAHIDTELEEDPPPVSCERLEAVLKRLGSPSQWLPLDELAWWRKVVLRLWTGPESWRLAYLCLGLFALALVPLPTIILFLPASYFLARAAVSLNESADEELGPRRWLIYPPLILVSLLLALFFLAFLFFPFVVGVAATLDNWQSPALRPSVFVDWHVAALATFGACGSAGIWWILWGSVLASKPQIVRLTFFPFGQWFRGLHGWTLTALGLVAVLLAAAIGFYYGLG